MGELPGISERGVLYPRRLPPRFQRIPATGQLSTVIEALVRAGHHRPGDSEILVVADVGYDVIRLGWGALIFLSSGGGWFRCVESAVADHGVDDATAVAG